MSTAAASTGAGTTTSARATRRSTRMSTAAAAEVVEAAKQIESATFKTPMPPSQQARGSKSAAAKAAAAVLAAATLAGDDAFDNDDDDDDDDDHGAGAFGCDADFDVDLDAGSPAGAGAGAGGRRPRGREWLVEPVVIKDPKDGRAWGCGYASCNLAFRYKGNLKSHHGTAHEGKESRRRSPQNLASRKAYDKKVYDKKRLALFATKMPAGTKLQERNYTEAEEVALEETYYANMPELVASLESNGVHSVAVSSGSRQPETATGLPRRFGALCPNPAVNSSVVGRNEVRRADQSTPRFLCNEEVTTWLAGGRVVGPGDMRVTPAKAMKNAAANFDFHEVGPSTDNFYAAACREKALQTAFMRHLSDNKDCGINILWTTPGVGGVTPDWRTLRKIDESITKKSRWSDKLAASVKGGLRFGTVLTGVRGGGDLSHNDWGWTGRTGKRTKANPVPKKKKKKPKL